MSKKIIINIDRLFDTLVISENMNDETVNQLQTKIEDALNKAVLSVETGEAKNRRDIGRALARPEEFKRTIGQEVRNALVSAVRDFESTFPSPLSSTDHTDHEGQEVKDL